MLNEQLLSNRVVQPAAYTIQPAVKPVWQQVVSCKRGLTDALPEGEERCMINKSFRHGPLFRQTYDSIMYDNGKQRNAICTTSQASR